MSITEKLLQTNQNYNVNEHDQKWIDYLCSYGNRLEYQQVRNESKNAMFAIMKYRRLLRGRGFGNIPFITLNTAYVLQDYIKVHSLLQELFLEPISDDQFDFILRKINSKDNGVMKLHERHLQDTGTRVLSIIMTL